MRNPFQKLNSGVRRLLVFGAGGFGREVAWLARQCWSHEIEIGFVVDSPEYLSGEVNGFPVHLLENCAPRPDTRFVVAVGDPELRARAAGLCKAQGLDTAVLVHPRVEASELVALGPGSVICAGSILTVNIEIGAHVHINLGCTIGHDAVIGNFSTLSPGVHVSGNVQIGERVYIGTGATLINGHANDPLVVGDGAVIAAGACVTRSVESGAMVAGVPAIRKR